VKFLSFRKHSDSNLSRCKSASYQPRVTPTPLTAVSCPEKGILVIGSVLKAKPELYDLYCEFYHISTGEFEKWPVPNTQTWNISPYMRLATVLHERKIFLFGPKINSESKYHILDLDGFQPQEWKSELYPTTMIDPSLPREFQIAESPFLGAISYDTDIAVFVESRDGVYAIQIDFLHGTWKLTRLGGVKSAGLVLSC
jgi:hypothetical protein